MTILLQNRFLKKWMQQHRQIEAAAQANLSKNHAAAQANFQILEILGTRIYFKSLQIDLDTNLCKQIKILHIHVVLLKNKCDGDIADGI